ncbi:MAG: class I SAM-dependent methyltransferase [Bacilli bacterium]
MNDIFNDSEFVNQYYEMLKDYQDEFVQNKFLKFIPKNLKVLELGFGTGLDYFALKDFYEYTISDYSKAFIDEFKKRYNIDAIQIDAKFIDINEKFDCIFSNKVLHVFTDEELVLSFDSQYNALYSDGYIFHTLWYSKDAIPDEYANRVNEAKLIELLDKKFEVIHSETYSEMEDEDSIVFIAKKLVSINAD